MRRNIAFFTVMSCLLGLVALPVQAELGLGGILSSAADQEAGLKAVGLAVKEAVGALYSSGQGNDAVQAGIVEILNEAVATGNEEAVRYALVGVLVAGGADNLDISKAAIDNSNAFSQFPDTTASVVASASLLISGSGGGALAAAGGGGGGGQEQTLGGGSPQDDQFGGGEPDDPMDEDVDVVIDAADGVVVPFGNIVDRDSSATPI